MGRPVRSERRTSRFHEPATEQTREIAVLVGVHLLPARPGGEANWADLDELERLADTAGAEVKARLEQRRSSPDVRSLLGKGKLEQLKQLCESVGADVVIFDNDLSPAQGRNVEKALECRVLDRTELILDIFARHARTRQSRLQVGLAQYEYLLPRLARMWKHLERQAGGIGTRGPGETQIETDRRIIRSRITQMKRELAVIDRRMATQHKQRSTQFRVALVGYTNAGKSSLMNRLTEAEVYVQDQLFATLDATTRRVETQDGHAFLLTDTVGFIRKLPHHLVESFRATLSEVNEADLLLHVVDAGTEDLEAHLDAVDQVLASVVDGEKPLRLVFNKIDTVGDVALARLRQQYPDALFTSALDGSGLGDLTGAIETLLRGQERTVLLRVAPDQPRSLALLHELGDVLSVEYEDDTAVVQLRVGGPNYGRILQLEGLEILEVARYR